MSENRTDIVTLASPFQSDALDKFSSMYADWHGYISLVVCIFGIPLNIINITVLTRKHMTTPINCILTWLAVSDMLTMISYVPFAFHFYCKHSANVMSAEKNSKEWMQFLVVYLNFSATTHTISIWLGVALAIFRYRHIQSPAKGNLTRMRRLIRSRLVVFGIYVGSVLLMIPNYVSYQLMERKVSENSTAYVFESWNLGTSDVKFVVMLNLFLYSIVAKLVPCVLIIVYGGLLLRTLKNKVRVKRRRLSENGMTTQRVMDTSRTTTMLLVVIVLFLITELPQGVLILLCIFLQNFFANVYIPLGDSMDIVALINSGVNFVLYCTMSQEFRRTFIRLFCSLSNIRTNKRALISTDGHKDSMQTTLITLRSRS